MQLKFDRNKRYAIALAGGGAKGAYEIGAWKALDEAGIQYDAVSGTSVGALNGAMMAMRDLPAAIRAWNDIRLSDVVAVDKEAETEMLRLIGGNIEFSDIDELIPHAIDVLRNRGLDIAPLRAWISELADVDRIKHSGVEFYVSTVCLSDRRGIEVHINSLPDDQVHDMLLASAYHPSFRLEKLGDKYYADGSFFDTLPIHSLVEAGYRDIIAVRLPGIGIERHFKVPEGVNISYVETHFDLGAALYFDSEQSKRNMEIGYYDAKRLLYGLYGRHYYIERSLSEREALDVILDSLEDENIPLRRQLEKELPRRAKELDGEDWDYYELMTALLEKKAEEKGIENMRIITDTELIDEVRK
ncbi:MAG: patatin-like phospholipase family protein [Candidatus Limivicinus sp.]|jgi:NTE family protein